MILECFRCGVCCIEFQAPLCVDEVRSISAFLGLKPDEFIREFTDSRWQGSEKLLAHDRGYCSFLDYDPSGKVNNCRIYQVRPAACRDWKPGPDRRECREGLDKYWQLSIDHSGRLQGGKEQIRKFRSFVKSIAVEISSDSN